MRSDLCVHFLVLFQMAMGGDMKRFEFEEVSRYLKVNGFEICDFNLGTQTGADVSAFNMLSKKFIKIEVKTLLHKKGSFVVKKVTKDRIYDDFVFIMYKGLIVQIISMQDHLKLCSPSGDRTMTKFLDLLE